LSGATPASFGDLAPVEAAQFGRFGQQRGAQHRTDPGHAAQQVFFLLPQRRAAQLAVEVAVALLEPGLEPADVRGDSPGARPWARYRAGGVRR